MSSGRGRSAAVAASFALTSSETVTAALQSFERGPSTSTTFASASSTAGRSSCLPTAAWPFTDHTFLTVVATPPGSSAVIALAPTGETLRPDLAVAVNRRPIARELAPLEPVRQWQVLLVRAIPRQVRLQRAPRQVAQGTPQRELRQRALQLAAQLVLVLRCPFNGFSF